MIDSDVLLAENTSQLIHEAQRFNKTANSNLQMVCLRPSKGLHGTVYHGKYFKSIDMFPPSQMPAYCNGQATFLSRLGKLKIYFCHRNISKDIRNSKLSSRQRFSRISQLEFII